MYLRTKSLVWVVLAILLVGITAMSGTAVAHDLMHAGHHTAGMHGTGMCSWMCAGTTLAVEISFGSSGHVACGVPIFPSSSPIPIWNLFSASVPRAPPVV